MERNFHSLDWSWSHFFSDGQKYGRDQSHKRAWCIYELQEKKNMLKKRDQKRVQHGELDKISDDDLELEGTSLLY